DIGSRQAVPPTLSPVSSSFPNGPTDCVTSCDRQQIGVEICLLEEKEPTNSLQGGDMRSHADGSVNIQTTSVSNPLDPFPCLARVVLISRYLRKHGVLTKIGEGVRFA